MYPWTRKTACMTLKSQMVVVTCLKHSHTPGWYMGVPITLVWLTVVIHLKTLKQFVSTFTQMQKRILLKCRFLFSRFVFWSKILYFLYKCWILFLSIKTLFIQCQHSLNMRIIWDALQTMANNWFHTHECWLMF